MPVEDVFNPKTKNPIDPKVEKKEKAQGDAEYFEKKRNGARAKREYEDEERAAKQAREREENPPEPPFQIKGSVNLGNIDVQEQQKELKETIDKIQNDAQAQIKVLSEKADNYRDDVHKIQLTMVENTLKAQIEQMQKMIADGLAKPKDPGIVEQINQIGQIAGVLGYAKPDASGALPAELKLQMFKMELEEKQRARQFEWDKITSDRNWQLELKKLDLEVSARGAEIAAEREKRSMLSSPFEAIGIAIARGLMDSGGEIPHPVSKKKAKRSEFQLQAGEGESGEVDCPECGEKVAIAPDARSTVCPSCEAKVTITRIPKSGAPE